MFFTARRVFRGLGVPLVSVAVLSAACSGGGDDASPSTTGANAPATTVSPSTTEPIPDYRSIVATAQVPDVAVFPEPDAAEPTHRLANPNEVGGPLVFLVDTQRPDGWIQVLLPVRPNGTTGWIRSEDVVLATNDYQLVVELDAHRVTLTRGDEVLVQEPVGVGRDNAPTPGGRFYIKELLEPPDPGTVYGPYAYGLSGFSNVFESFNGGDGVIGIHGNNDPSSIGSDVSAGCIRLDNDTIVQMVEEIGLPLGTPVEILA